MKLANLLVCWFVAMFLVLLCQRAVAEGAAASELYARFKVSGLKNGETVAIKATSPSGLAIPETTVTSDADGVIILPSTESTTPLPQSGMAMNILQCRIWKKK